MLVGLKVLKGTPGARLSFSEYKHYFCSRQPLGDREVLLNQSRDFRSSAQRVSYVLTLAYGKLERGFHRWRDAFRSRPRRLAPPPSASFVRSQGRATGRRPTSAATRAGACRTLEGIDAGHIAQGGKRQRAQSPAAWPLPVSVPDHWNLLSMQGIFDSRYTRPAPCRTPPSANTNTHAYPFPSPRCCKLDRIP